LKKSNKLRSRRERILLAIFLLLLIATPIVTIYFKSSLSEVNIRVEKMKKSIAIQEKKNESLEMKINELASLDNVQDIIKQEGLTYNNDNIKNINR
jgi:cell division protein FtsL